MLIDFSTMEWKDNPHFKDGEGSLINKMFVSDETKIMLGKLEPGSSIGMHTHEGDFEVVYILEGSGTMLSPDGDTKAVPGTAQYCPEGHGHSLVNDGAEDLIFFAVIPKK